jgi:hypothetical protein
MAFRHVAIVVLAFLASGCRVLRPAVSVRVVNDYAFGDYRGDFISPPSADGNPKRAVIVSWRDHKHRLVFSHEASYCPWLELADGSAACFQFFEGNDGIAELFNQFGRREENSHVEIVEKTRNRVHVRWTYYGVNQTTGERYYAATEDFVAMRNGQVLRRQRYRSLKPDDPHGYAREPIELIGLCPVGQTWRDVLAPGERPGERHALTALDPFSDRRYDVFWMPKPDTVVGASSRRTGCTWPEIDDSAGIVLALPLRTGTPFVIFGTSSGFDAATTRLKDHSFTDTGGIGWMSQSWDHWPIGWINSQAHEVDATTLGKYPNHFAPAGMDFFAQRNEQVERREHWSLVGVGGRDFEDIRRQARAWLER